MKQTSNDLTIDAIHYVLKDMTHKLSENHHLKFTLKYEFKDLKPPTHIFIIEHCDCFVVQIGIIEPCYTNGLIVRSGEFKFSHYSLLHSYENDTALKIDDQNFVEKLFNSITRIVRNSRPVVQLTSINRFVKSFKIKQVRHRKTLFNCVEQDVNCGGLKLNYLDDDNYMELWINDHSKLTDRLKQQLVDVLHRKHRSDKNKVKHATKID